MPDDKGIYERNVHTKTLFAVEIADDGGYFAVRDTSPMFCVKGDSIAYVCTQAIAVLDAYKALKER